MMVVRFRLHDATCAVPAESTLEMTAGDKVAVTPLPAAPPQVLGVFRSRGATVPLVDLRATLGMPSQASEVEELRAVLAAREQDHVDWLAELHRCAHGGGAFTKPTDPSACAFGRWYDGLRADPAQLRRLTGDRLAQEAQVRGWDAPHRAIHALASTVLAEVQRGNLAGAQAELAAGHTALAALRASFREFLVGFEEQRRAMLVICQTPTTRLALAVDQLLSVEDVPPDQLAPVPGLAATAHRFLSGLRRRPDGGTELLVDPDRVARELFGAEPGEARAAS